MLLHIDNVLSSDDCQAILAATADSALWKDGKATARGSARVVKENRQADSAAPAVKGALAKIQATLSTHPVFVAAAHPATFIRMTINQYAEGMAYGDHVDAPYIDGRRTDLSFTVFLTPPDDYDGGALVIDNAGHED
ncbi:MAG: PKHD-type hydroxylase, partial [Pseudomonadota bacterium]